MTKKKQTLAEAIQNRTSERMTMVRYSKEPDSMPEGWTTRPLGELLTDAQIKRCKKFFRAKDMPGLRVYLNSFKDELEKKGIVADFLYYWMRNSFGG